MSRGQPEGPVDTKHAGLQQLNLCVLYGNHSGQLTAYLAEQGEGFAAIYIYLAVEERAREKAIDDVFRTGYI